ncbi:unnamed protein product [Nesidiocoris tenuis]|uniref:DUF5641 domain-containing protein n=1 Tax=Nesidiocoris tenuis TaxID=355587 RepID=A0A6H5GN99_9HEMI|nr:unnamed protein product [Nesidiocoris tenuis]
MSKIRKSARIKAKGTRSVPNSHNVSDDGKVTFVNKTNPLPHTSAQIGCEELNSKPGPSDLSSKSTSSLFDAAHEINRRIRRMEILSTRVQRYGRENTRAKPTAKALYSEFLEVVPPDGHQLANWMNAVTSPTIAENVALEYEAQYGILKDDINTFVYDIATGGDDVSNPTPEHPRKIEDDWKMYTRLLPSVPIFSGEPSDFLGFKSIFDLAVHERNLPAQVKLSGLKSKLSGRPLALIQHFERRLSKQPELYETYRKFMLDYLQSGHMEPTTLPNSGQITYYLPHHAVHRDNDPPEKIRVVFNASQKSSTGLSLNDILLPGPSLQLNIADVVTRFRSDRFVFTADVRQMFRQIEHIKSDRDMLRIIWRNSSDDPIQDYRLKTVTYGTASAPYLACRVLQELADEGRNSHPIASTLILTRTYVDDINGGGDTIPEALQARDELVDLLSSAQFELRVDYAGPFNVSIAGLRGNRTMKCYICLFVCFATKAVHIETATDLSTPAFLAAYRRFVSRRGLPSDVWSDNGTNFEGAANEFKRLQSLLKDDSHRNVFSNETSKNGTTWHFIPPSAPHFGGLWEAGVKAAKRLLKVTLRTLVPTLQEFITLTTQIESVLNSRPITAFSTSPDDMKVLTPGHFLVFRPLNAAPVDVTLTDRTALRSRWETCQHAFNCLWKRWQQEYLADQQKQTKWLTPGRAAKVGDVVILMEDNLPPLQWEVGRITELFPGPDGQSRVADVKTPRGIFRRTVRKLCPLPTQ